ncbi:MAG TPA: hypothetical protein VNF75_00280 [Candidatus Dormibacteraeota bacterium]|nr:hypothetical protein [Candidatus Dormibacteraeota bacterium]
MPRGLPELPEIAAKVATELRRRADGPGIEGVVADGLLRLLHHSAHLMTEFGNTLEQAITPEQAPRARRAAPRKSAGRPSRVHKLRPED